MLLRTYFCSVEHCVKTVVPLHLSSVSCPSPPSSVGPYRVHMLSMGFMPCVRAGGGEGQVRGRQAA